MKGLLPVGEERDVVVGLQTGEDPERRRDREDPEQADTPRRPIHQCNIGRARANVKRGAGVEKRA